MACSHSATTCVALAVLLIHGLLAKIGADSRNRTATEAPVGATTTDLSSNVATGWGDIHPPDGHWGPTVGEGSDAHEPPERTEAPLDETIDPVFQAPATTEQEGCRCRDYTCRCFGLSVRHIPTNLTRGLQRL
jgi:hypothetical protein